MRPSIAFYGGFSLDMGRSPGFGSAWSDSGPIKTWFPFGSGLYVLNLARPGNSPDRSTESTRSRAYGAPTACRHRVSGSLSLPSRGPFHLSFTVLCSIGRQVVFSLAGWSPRVPTGFHVPRGTLDPAAPPQASPTGLSPSPAGLPRAVWLPSSVACAVRTPPCTHGGLGSSGSARRYSRNRFFFLFLRLLRCFSSPGSLLHAYVFGMGWRGLPPPGLPIQAPADPWVCAPPRGFSQLVAPFVRPVPFFA